MANASPTSVIHLKSLSGSLSLLGLSLAVAGATTMILLQLERETAAAHQQALAQQAAVRAAGTRNNAQEIHAQIALYQELVDRGHTAPERRQDWTAALRHIQASRRLLGLDYEIAPQRPLDAKNPSSGGYQFLASPMKLRMPVLHENDLLGLLADLAEQTQALVSVKRCRLERVTAGPAPENAATLKAACEIDWITLQAGS